MERTSPIECLRPETLTWTQAESMSRLRGRAEGHSLCTIANYAYTMCQAIPVFCSRGADRPAAVTTVHAKTIQRRYRCNTLDQKMALVGETFYYDVRPEQP